MTIKFSRGEQMTEALASSILAGPAEEITPDMVAGAADQVAVFMRAEMAKLPAHLAFESLPSVARTQFPCMVRLAFAHDIVRVA